jgi:hypothetical protein
MSRNTILLLMMLSSIFTAKSQALNTDAENAHIHTLNVQYITDLPLQSTFRGASLSYIYDKNSPFSITPGLGLTYLTDGNTNKAFGIEGILSGKVMPLKYVALRGNLYFSPLFTVHSNTSAENRTEVSLQNYSAITFGPEVYIGNIKLSAELGFFLRDGFQIPQMRFGIGYQFKSK